jgi:hypothetical protein
LFVYIVVRDFLTLNSPVAYYSEGRVIDLSGLSDPGEGAIALSAAVELCLENGSIDNQGIGNSFTKQLGAVRSHLQAGECDEALKSLGAFINHVRAQSGKHVSSESAARLTFLANRLEESISSNCPAPGSLETAKMLPQGFELHQNHPNPFNPETQISYSLPQEADVRLVVYNMLGQRVRLLVDGYQSAGNNTVTWDGRDENGEQVATGVYFYRLRAGEFVQTKKMSLVK